MTDKILGLTCISEELKEKDKKKYSFRTMTRKRFNDLCNLQGKIEAIKELKEDLASLEISVDDCINILTGYLNVQTSLATQAMPPVEENDDK